MKITKERTGSAVYVQALGGFSISFDGHLIAGAAKSKESQFISLMQLLLHYQGQGVRRDMLEQVLFGDREIQNTHHALQSVVYNAKKQLRQAGLPEGSYITLKNGAFYWTEEIPVIEDAVEFERLCREAEAEPDAEKRLQRSLLACHSYGGEFLPTHTGFPWAAREARRYHVLFCSCMEQAVALLRELREYRQMEALGRYAAEIDPEAEWEAVTMEALMAMGSYERAGRFYEDTAERYLKEQGQQPPVKMQRLVKRLGNQILHQYEILGSIQEQLSEQGKDKPGGYLCTYAVFQGLYQMAERLVEREGRPAWLMLCTLVDGKGNPLRDGSRLEEWDKKLEAAILASVGCCDAVNHYGKGQCLALLQDWEGEDCGRLQEAIRRKLAFGHVRIRVHYEFKRVGALTGFTL